MKHGWEYKKLGEVCTLTMGQSPASESYNSESDGLPFFQGCSDFGKINPTIRIYCNAPTKIAEANDVLMSVRAPIGTLNIANVRCCIGRGLASFRATTKATNSYLYYFLKHSRNKLEALGTGSTFKAIGKDALFKFPIPIPPIKEQEEICSLLDKLSLVIEKKKQQVKELDNLAQAIFYDVFGNPVENEKGWEYCTLAKLIEDSVITYHLDGNHGGDYPRSEEFVDVGVPYIGANSIVNGTVDFSMAKHLTEERAKRLRKGIAKNRDVLFAHNATVGPVAILKTDEEKVILSTSLTAYRCNEDRILPHFLKAYMGSEWFVCQYKSVMKQATRNQVPITKQKEMLFILPPLPLQQSFAQKVESIERQKELINQSIREAQTLFDSRMEYYFGE
jgi:type I restriction enzyme S subunit